MPLRRFSPSHLLQTRRSRFWHSYAHVACAPILMRYQECLVSVVTHSASGPIPAPYGFRGPHLLYEFHVSPLHQSQIWVALTCPHESYLSDSFFFLPFNLFIYKEGEVCWVEVNVTVFTKTTVEIQSHVSQIIGFKFWICRTLKTKQEKSESHWRVRIVSGIAALRGNPNTSRELASSGTSFLFENKEPKFLYKVKNPFVHKIITFYFICFVNLDFCSLDLVKVKHTRGKNKSILLCPIALLSPLFHRIKIQGGIKMYSVYVKLLMCAGEIGSFPGSSPAKLLSHPHQSPTHPWFAFCCNYTLATTNFSPCLELPSSFMTAYYCISCFCHLEFPFSPLHWLNHNKFLRSNANVFSSLKPPLNC